MKKKITFGILAVLLLFVGLHHLYTMYWVPDNFLRQIYLVPHDAMYILETDDPFTNWKKFSRSEPWKYLQGQEKMKEISDNVHTLDSLLHENKTLLGLLGKRNLMISAHMTRRSDFDFLFVVDMQKTSKLESLKQQMENLFKTVDYKVTSRKYKHYKILELFDPKERTTLYMSFVDNHMVCSFTGLLVEKAIQEKETPTIGRDLYFLDVQQKMKNGGLCKIYINYRYFDQYLTLLSGSTDENMKSFCRSLQFTGVKLDASDKELSLTGYSNPNDSIDSYLLALLKSGRNKISAQKILSNRTAFLMNMGFDDGIKFIDNVEEVMKNTPEAYSEFKKNWDRIEGFLGIDIRENFLSWMDGEVVFAQNTPGSLGYQNEFVAVVRMKDKKQAVEHLRFIEERIRKKTPVKFKTIDYEQYSIHYMEVKGFFRLIFGKMFDKLNKPYYTIIDDYVVFSNSTATLLSMIEDYRNRQTLDRDSEFKSFVSKFNSKASVFAYSNTRKFFPLWKDLVVPSTWNDLQGNSNFVLCFPQTGFQLTGEGNLFDTRLITEFEVPKKDDDTALDAAEEAEAESDFYAREDTLGNLETFYVEKMSNKIYTEFYEEGAIKSKTEMKNGIRHGKHKTFYPDGKLKVNGKFKNNKRVGTWRYYDESEKLIRKEKL